MRFGVAFAVLLIAAGCRLGSPAYTSRIDAAGASTFVAHVSSDSGMNEDVVRRALLTEAARATIDRGAIYLVVQELTTDSSTQRRESQPAITNNAAPEAGPQSNATFPTAPDAEAAGRSEISFVRVRNGNLRFSISGERPAGLNVFDASQLLDMLGRGEMPVITETRVIVQ